MHVLTDNAALLSRAFGTTLLLSAGGGALAVVVGLLVGVARMSPVPFLRRAGGVYVETIRNTPLTVVFFLIVFVLPQLGFSIPSYSVSAIAALGFYTAAFVSEAVRAGVNTVGRGQAEAARALGLSFAESMRFIIVPQALRAVVPPLANVWIALVKNTSVAAGFGVLELTASGQRINFLDPAAVVQALVWIAVAYLVITLGSALGFRRLEHRLAVAR
ncbi:glutamate transport system permease protein [Nocardia transvalensis]|uniref:Glutamate transport system permease protein n=1 Tax=Nocardia transvalensis TaxID=37333 RepID=A0A7W9UHJ9_9NOCA|nr:amino acid ABC transporter permease [Nocardia transvalensis]MBB5912795.1 glutamate transport system permease protein [Nocardia transvalensis]